MTYRKDAMHRVSTKINRRDTLKMMGVASLAGLTWTACESQPEAEEHHVHTGTHEISEADQQLMNERFFTDHEMKTVTVLGDLIIPADERSGSASDAGTPEFIEFMMKDQPWHQVGMRGGLRWLDMQCLKQFEQKFADCSEAQQKEMLDQIAYPEQAAPEMSQGVNFFNNFRNFVATGFFTSKIGVDDLEYVGNRPNVWQGSPPEVLARLGVSYDSVSEYTFA
ncbi:MAG: gluconate 2-dehydrogenase subunit 3 family protein [Tunicatimonas sp.]